MWIAIYYGLNVNKEDLVFGFWYCDLSDVDSSPAKSSLRTADAFPVVASLPPKNNVCEPERQNDFRDMKPF